MLIAADQPLPAPSCTVLRDITSPQYDTGLSMSRLWPPSLPWATSEPSASTTTRTPTSAVMSEVSYGGDTSTTSRPQMPSAATSPRIFKASRGKKPPGSGQPVPGTNPQSSESTSKEM